MTFNLFSKTFGFNAHLPSHMLGHLSAADAGRLSDFILVLFSVVVFLFRRLGRSTLLGIFLSFSKKI